MRDAAGFSLVEALVAVFILTLIALSMAQLIGLGILADRTSDSVTEATTLSTRKLEQLRNQDYDLLVAGGDVDKNVKDYWDTVDTNGDGNADYTRRWRITDQGGGKLIEVRVVANVAAIGPAKDALMATIVADR